MARRRHRNAIPRLAGWTPERGGKHGELRDNALQKLTGMGSVASALQHCYRERETPNADAERTPENYCSVSQSADEAMGKLRELLPEKRRKDAVLAVEYVMTAPEWWKEATPRQQAEFFARSEQWLEKKYGKDRVVAAVVHRDEATRTCQRSWCH